MFPLFMFIQVISLFSVVYLSHIVFSFLFHLLALGCIENGSQQLLYTQPSLEYELHLHTHTSHLLGSLDSVCSSPFRDDYFPPRNASFSFQFLLFYTLLLLLQAPLCVCVYPRHLYIHISTHPAAEYKIECGNSFFELQFVWWKYLLHHAETCKLCCYYPFVCTLILTLILSLLSDASVENKIGISISFFCLFAHSFCACVCARVIYSSIQCRCLRDTIYKKIKIFKSLLTSQQCSYSHYFRS